MARKKHPHIQRYEYHRDADAVLLDKEGEGVIALGVGHLHAHRALTRAAAEYSAAVDGYHRTFGVGKLVDGDLHARRGPQFEPRRDTSVRRLAASQTEQRDQRRARHGPLHESEYLRPPHAADVEHRQREHERQHGRRCVGGHYDHAREHYRDEDRESAFAPHASLLGLHPRPELQRRHDLHGAHGRLPRGELLRQIHHQRHFQHLRGLELESEQRNPTRRAVGRHAHEVDRRREQQRQREERRGELAVGDAVNPMHEKQGYDAQRQQKELRAQKLRRRDRRTGVVGHLGGGRVYHQHRDNHQRYYDDPQHAVAAEQPSRQSYRAAAARLGSGGRLVGARRGFVLDGIGSPRPTAGIGLGVGFGHTSHVIRVVVVFVVGHDFSILRFRAVRIFVAPRRHPISVCFRAPTP